MNFFECCQKCKHPKRYPGCSAKCPEYAKGRKLLNEAKKRERLHKDLSRYDKLYPNG